MSIPLATTPILTLRSPEQEKEFQAKLLRAKQTFWRAIKYEQPAFEKDLSNIDALNACAHWLIQEPYNDVTIGKGINLTGPVGTGKTLMMQALSRAMVLGGDREGFPVVNALRIVKEFNRSDSGSRDRNDIGGDQVILRYANMPRLCIDDMALESTGMFYGRAANVIGEIMMLRYEKWRRGECITHTTTNGDPSSLEKVYDTRVLTRWTEKTGEVYLGGVNRRPSAAPPSKLYVMPTLFEQREVPKMPTDEEAREHFNRIKETMNEVVATLRVEKPEPRNMMNTSLEQDLSELRMQLVAMDIAQLEQLRTELLGGAHEPDDKSRPYIALIDAELSKKESATDDKDA